MKFDEAVRSVLSKYATFEGRARRSEYWYWVLFVWVASIVLSIVDGVVGTGGGLGGGALSGLFSLATFTFLPSLAVGVRRLHDAGKSGWNLLWSLTIIGVLYVLYLLIRAGQPGTNQYGPEPGGAMATAG